MSWMDLLRMSVSSLRRRKLRTFLTILGVVIGTASIVVMISLGLGMQQSLYDEVEQSGGLTTITVTGKEGAEQAVYSGPGSSGEEQSDQRITDQSIEKFGEVANVEMVSPVYDMSVILLKGKYEGYIQLTGMTQEGLKARKIEFRSGGLPKTNSSQLELIYGNMTLQQFYEKSSGKSYWDTQELPDIDLAKDALFLILDADAYSNSSGQQFAGADSGDAGSNSDGKENASQAIQKHIVCASGMVAGGIEEYNANSYAVYCDLDTLTKMLKKEFSGKVIPGQPTTKSGKPYKEFCYTSAQVKVNDIDNVDQVSKELRDMGFGTQTNEEYLETMKGQFAIIQAVLGGIGAVSLLVAAIGIANTMMMSIYERTKEIGVIKVLGCSLKNIKQMFLLEAAFIGFIGGVAGNLLSVLMSAVINFIVGQSGSVGISGNISIIPVWLALVSTGFAVAVGVAAGYFPALRAMRLSPLAAIRSE